MTPWAPSGVKNYNTTILFQTLCTKSQNVQQRSAAAKLRTLWLPAAAEPEKGRGISGSNSVTPGSAWRRFEPVAIHRCDLDHSHRGSGSTPSNSFFWPPGVLPVQLYHFCGSTSYEYSQCLFFNSLGVVPQALYHFCGSTPIKVV